MFSKNLCVLPTILSGLEMCNFEWFHTIFTMCQHGQMPRKWNRKSMTHVCCSSSWSSLSHIMGDIKCSIRSALKGRSQPQPRGPSWLRGGKLTKVPDFVIALRNEKKPTKSERFGQTIWGCVWTFSKVCASGCNLGSRIPLCMVPVWPTWNIYRSGVPGMSLLAARGQKACPRIVQ